MIRAASAGAFLALLAAAPQDKPLPKAELAGAIDRVLEPRWSQVKDGAAPLADDFEFLRRLSLDLRGYPPDLADAIAFIKDDSPHKRAAKIEDYLAGDAFSLQFSQWLGSILFDNYRTFDIQPGKNLNNRTKIRLRADFMKQLRDMVAKDTPLVQILKDLLEATGKSNENPLIAYKLSMYDGDPAHLTFAERVPRAWLGVRVGCAQCHEHPFDRWTQEDYYGLAGFYSKHKAKPLEVKGDACDEVEIYEDPKAPELPNPDTGGIIKPKFLYGGSIQPTMPRMPALAVFLAGREHNQLARNFANRMWAWLMGRGLVHPVDEFNQRNRPSHEGLMETLSKDLASGRYSLRHLARGICNSKAYQRASLRSEAGDVKEFARAAIRQLTASQLFNSVAVALRGADGILDREGGAYRAGWDWYARQMDLVFGSRSGWVEVSFLPGNARQMLLLRNGDVFQDWLKEGDALPARTLNSQVPLSQKVREVFLAVLTRMPSEAERMRWESWLQKHNASDGFEDFVWTLINSTEFVTRH